MEDIVKESAAENTLEQLKAKLKVKLDSVKTGLRSINSKLLSNIKNKNSKITEENTKYLNNLKETSMNFVEHKKKKIKDKEIISHVYFEAIRNIKRTEIFEKNLTDIILDSLNNYNNFIKNQLPFYKNACQQFLKNQEDKLCNNNIYAKLTKKQIDKIYHQLNSKNLINFINGKYPINLKMLISDSFLEECSTLSSTTMFKVNSVEIDKLNDHNFHNFFSNIRENKTSKISDLIFKNCDLKANTLAEIPFEFQNLNIVDSKIYCSIFFNMKFSNLFKFSLDNVQIDSYNFEKILKNILKVGAKNLKEFSAKNNYISRIYFNEEFDSSLNTLQSLEIFNLSNNIIYNVDKRMFNFIPNLKILDLSNNNLLHQNNCKELIMNCKGIVLLLKNIIISKDPFYNFYLDYYNKFISKNTFNTIPLDYINFDSLFYQRNNINILKWDFQYTKNIENISEFNLSSCSLDNKNVIDIISNCISIKNNISKINISYNLLTEEIFDLLIEDKINRILFNLKELDLSHNLIKFKFQKLTSKPRFNQFSIFLDNYSKLELLNLKSTPFEETINYFIKDEIKLSFAKEKKREFKIANENEHKEIKDIIENNNLNINKSFHFIINDLVTLKYTNPKRLKSIIPFLEQHLIVENYKPEEKKEKEK